MKLFSSSRSFALLALSLINIAPIRTLSIDSKAGKLEPRLDGYGAPASSFPSTPLTNPTRRRKSKCSGAGTGIGSVAGPYATSSGFIPPPQNGTTLASTLPYPRSSGSATSLPPVASSSGGTSPLEPTIPNGCGKSVVTVTNEHTVTVTATPGEKPVSSGHNYLSTTGSATAASSPDVAVPATSVVASSGLSTSSRSIPTTHSKSPILSGKSTSRLSNVGVPDETPSASTTTCPSDTASKAARVSSRITADPVGVSTSASPSSIASSHVSSGSGGSTNETSGAPYDRTGEFWAGADIDTVLRMEALPGRTFYDYDEKTVKDPIKTLGDAGLNSFRVETFRGDCLGPTNFVNNATSLSDELDFKLDFGCISAKVETAKQAKAAGLKLMQHTINQGLNIPKGMEQYSYQQMVQEVQKETKRQLQPFLDAGIVPDVILFENEGSDGFLFHDETTGRDRASSDEEKCGQIPTGKMNSYPQYAGYLKAEVVACNEAIKAAGFPIESVRYGLHSHGQYVQWKESIVHGPNRPSQTELKKSDGSPCDGPNPIPSNLLAMDVAVEMTIAGFSAYPDPMRPDDIHDANSLRATLDRLHKTLTEIQEYSGQYGTYSDGPFKGQPKLQALGVEYATQFKFSEDPQQNEIPQQQQHTEMMWEMVKSFPTFMGMLWWEPWYCNNHWEGGEATMCHLSFGAKGSGIVGEAPTNTLITWGKAAVSPWKTITSRRRRIR
ncbi:MAG: hypothetical protein L6R39_003620 [Caloplaca ligustica]|nr:MAG: hypothetical protein L6R39_003620 [Caloplaca ligustica]